MTRELRARGAVLALRLSLVAVAVLVAAAVAPRVTIVPLPHLKNAPLSSADLRSVLLVFFAYHLVAYGIATAVGERAHAFSSARRALGELYVVMVASSLASCHLFLFSLVPFSANFHAFVGALLPALHVGAALAFAYGRGQREALRTRLALLRVRTAPLVLSRWTAVTCAVVAAPGVLAVLYKKNGDFANLVNNVRVSLNVGAASGLQLVEALPGLDLDQPMDVRFSPADPRHLFVIERPGRLVRIDLSRERPAREVALDFTDEVNGNHVEAGALSFALHPEFGRAGSPRAGHVFVWYTHCRPGLQRNRLARYDLAARDPIATRELLVDQGRPATGFHNGGSVFFDAEGFLYWTCGDFAVADPQRIDQALAGGVFRIDPDRRGGDVSAPSLRQPEGGVTAGYFIPRTNPFAGRADALGEFFALGLRNPFRASLDPETGDVWVGDVGLDRFEEATRLAKGGNGQWPIFEAAAPAVRPMPARIIGEWTPPALHYAQTSIDRCIIGGVLYRGDRHPALRGKYIYADNNSGIVRAFDPERPDAPPVSLGRAALLGQQGITSVNTAPDGSLLVTVLGSKQRPSGQLLRLEEVTTTVAAAPAPTAPGEATYVDVSSKFEQVCARCHGSDGRGEPSLESGLAKRPDFTDPSWQAARTDEELRRVVLDGGSPWGKSRDMPSWRGFFSEPELDLLIRRIRDFARGEQAK